MKKATESIQIRENYFVALGQKLLGPNVLRSNNYTLSHCNKQMYEKYDYEKPDRWKIEGLGICPNCRV